MSQENVEIVEGFVEAFRSRDHERPFAFYDPKIEWDATELAEVIPDLAGIYHGHDGVRAFWRRWLSAWKDLQFEHELHEAGEHVALLVHNQRQWGRHSGVATEVPPYAWVFTIQHAKVIRVRFFASQTRALQAMGLQTDANHARG